MRVLPQGLLWLKWRGYAVRMFLINPFASKWWFVS
jgi:hypothetical protein